MYAEPEAVPILPRRTGRAGPHSDTARRVPMRDPDTGIPAARTPPSAPVPARLLLREESLDLAVDRLGARARVHPIGAIDPAPLGARQGARE